MKSNRMPTPPVVAATPAPVTVAKGSVYTGTSDVAYTNGTVPNSSTRNFWATLTPPKAVSQDKTDTAVLNEKGTIAAKVATDLANEKQAADAATGVVDNTVASKAATAAAAAVQSGNKKTTDTIYFALAIIAALFGGATWLLKKKKHA